MIEVVIVSNDIVPGLGLPVAAPGLRAHGLAAGLRSHGIEAIVTVPGALVEREWSKRARSRSWPSAPGAVVLADQDLSPFIERHRPAAVVLTNSNRFEAAGRHPRTRFIFDFFAPKMMEVAETPGPDREQRLAALSERKLRALDRADAVIVNGRKKLPYVQEWLARTPRGAGDRPVEVVEMAMEPCFAAPREDGFIHVAMAGYLVGWLSFGKSLDALQSLLEEFPELVLHLWMPSHWGGGGRDHPEFKRLSELGAHTRSRRRGPQLFEDFQHHLSQMHLFIDLFLRTPERELATVTRTVTATACGLPVLHPPFTECAPRIAEYDAGWLVDASDEERLAASLKEAVSDRDGRARKRTNARRLATEVFSPQAATLPLAQIIRSWR